MKNFRKVLALVLVVATLLSFTAMASAVKYEYLDLDYADQATITPGYEAAVDLLTTIGILNGYESGDEFYFKPGNEIDRDEVAKMVAVLANAGDDIQEYYAEACTFADVKDTWAASYVAYCYHAGIVAGRNATTFDPDASITGIEVAKMMLCVMGFDAEAQGYVGKDWKVNVLRDAKKVDLFEGLEADFNAAANASREEVAMMMFNMLHANVVVGYVSQNIVKITNALYEDLNVSLKDINDGDFILYGQAIAIPGTTVGSMYGFEHEIVIDCQGRPYDKWSLQNDKAGTRWAKVYAIPYKTRSVDGIKEVNTTYLYEDGKLLNANDAKYDGLYKDVKGLIVETYQYYNAEVGAYESITVVLNTGVSFVDWTGKYQGVPYYKTLDGTEAMKNTEGFEVGDVVLVHYCNAHAKLHGKYVAPGSRQVDYTIGEHDAYLADMEIVEVTDASFTNSQEPTDWDRANSYFKADGQKFEYHYNAAGELVYEDNDPVIVDTLLKSAARGEEYAIYRDEAGYVVLWTAAENVEEKYDFEYGFFQENSWTIKLGDTISADGDDLDDLIDWNGHFYNDMVDFNGKAHNDVELDVFSLVGLMEYVEYNGIGALAEYYVDEDGLTVINDVAEVSETPVVLANGEVDVDNGVVATTNTMIMVRTFDPADNEYVYEVYNGYKELAKEYPEVIMGDDGSYAEVQYFVSATNPNKATYVFVDAAATLADDKFFVLGWEETHTSIQTGDVIEYFDVYSAVVDGELAHVYVDTDMIEEGEAAEELASGLYNVEVMYLGVAVDGLPIYRTAGMSMDVIDGTDFDMIELDGDQLFFEVDGDVEHLPMADDYKVWVIDISYNEDKGAWTYVDVEEYTTADEFNDEIVNNAGYFNRTVWVEVDEFGYAEEVYVCRYAEYEEPVEDEEGFWS